MNARSRPDIPPPFDEAIKRHEVALMRLALRLTKDREEALDLFQETWLRAYRAYARLDSASGLKPWLFRIAINLSRSQRRDRIRRERFIVRIEESRTNNGSATENYEELRLLRRAIEMLPSKQKHCLKMRKFEGRSYADIAATMRCSEQSARANVHQALKKLKEFSNESQVRPRQTGG
jgi:RNA polymerase sigma-70 factor (ECF subfamily)